MDRAALLEFLERAGARSLEGYLSEHGSDPLAALDERLQWAAWNFRDAAHREEARFLMEHHGSLREVLQEGETAWHLRLRRAENAAKRGGTPPPAPPVPPDLRSRAPEAVRTSGLPLPPPSLSNAPTVEPTTPVSRKAASPSSEAPTVIRDDPSERGVRTADVPPMRSMMPTGLDRTIADLDDDDDAPGAASPVRLGLEKTGIVGDDDDPMPERHTPASLPGPVFSGTPMGAPLRGRSPTDQTAMVLAVGLSLAGFGALALAAALIISSVIKSPDPTPTPAPPAQVDAP